MGEQETCRKYDEPQAKNKACPLNLLVGPMTVPVTLKVMFRLRLSLQMLPLLQKLSRAVPNKMAFLAVLRDQRIPKPESPRPTKEG